MSADRYAYLPTMVVVPYTSALFARILQAIDPEESSEPESEVQPAAKILQKSVVIQPKPKQRKRQPAVAVVISLLFGTVANMSANLMDTWRNEPSAYSHSIR